MIGSLRGTLVDRSPDGEVLVEVGGVGYRVAVSPTTAVQLSEVGSEVFLWVHHNIREDHQALYGFRAREERVCFEALLGAHGVGPSLAMAILSVHPPAVLVRVLADEDVAALCLVPGVGKKTAARLLVELKSRLDVPELAGAGDGVGVDGGSSAGSAAGSADGGGASARADVREALGSLGYSLEEIHDALSDLPADGDASLLLKAALQRLAVASR